MKHMKKIVIGAISFLILICTLTSCVTIDPNTSDTSAGESNSFDDVTTIDEQTSIEDNDSSEQSDTDTTETEKNEETTKAPSPWVQDTEKFNRGKVRYDYITENGKTVVSATPLKGNKLGLDITDKSDLVSICYSVWFDAILGSGTGKVTSWHNISEILEGKRDWGPENAFHYWATPAVGYYYRSSDKAVIRQHMTQLYTAGVDFIIIDLTNAGDNYIGNNSWTSYIKKPMDAICDTIMEMRAEGLGTPYVVFWAGDSDGPLYRELYNKYHNVDRWKDCFVYWNDKPFMLTTHKQPADFPYQDLFTVRSMWGLRGSAYKRGQWSFLEANNRGIVAYDKYRKAEQVCVAVAAQQNYMSNKATATGREGGFTWYKQWYNAFSVHPKVVTVTWWNEWTAQRIKTSDNEYHFTDNYTPDYSRDIEPMSGGHGDQYYQWLIKYISAYKGGLDCPILVESEYLEKAKAWKKQQG